MRLTGSTRLRWAWAAAAVAVIVVAAAVGVYLMRPDDAGRAGEEASGAPSLSASDSVAGSSDPAQPDGQGATTVRTSAQLQAALSSARPGQTIALADGVYRGQFVIKGTSGTAAAPITVSGSRGAVLTGASLDDDYGLHLDGASHWRLTGFTITGSQKGIVLDRSAGVVLDGLDVGVVGQEGIHLRTFSRDNVVRDCDIHDTGLRDPGFGEGVYIGSAQSNWKTYTDGEPDTSDGNQAIGNRLRGIAAEGFDIKEGTSGGVIEGNTIDGAAITGENFADSYLDVKGIGYRIDGNTFVNPSPSVLDGIQTHAIVDGGGSGNSFAGNVLDGAVPGYGINIDAKTSGNAVSCTNAAPGAAKGLSNVTCG